MNKLKYHTICVLSIAMCMLGMHTVIAQERSVKIDTAFLEVKTFKESIKERYTGSDFDYAINDTGGVNLIQSVFRKFFGWLSDIFGFDIDVNYQTLERIIYGILGIAALYLLIRFLLQSPVSSVFKNQEKTIESFKYVEENLTEINFDSLIKDALKDNNYRLAIRYLYLSSLKTLTHKQFIEWHFDKTNSDYINEIKDQSIKTIFKRISYIYDYVWYGEFPIDEAKFNQHKIEFNHLLSAIANG